MDCCAGGCGRRRKVAAGAGEQQLGSDAYKAARACDPAATAGENAVQARAPAESCAAVEREPPSIATEPAGLGGGAGRLVGEPFEGLLG